MIYKHVAAEYHLWPEVIMKQIINYVFGIRFSMYIMVDSDSNFQKIKKNIRVYLQLKRVKNWITAYDEVISIEMITCFSMVHYFGPTCVIAPNT